MFVGDQIWDRQTLECQQVLKGHTGSVLCLQYDDNYIISASSDSTVRLVLCSFLILNVLLFLSQCFVVVTSTVEQIMFELCQLFMFKNQFKFRHGVVKFRISTNVANVDQLTSSEFW